MSIFCETPKSIVKRLSELKEDADERDWEHFTELYRPAICEFLRMSSPSLSDADTEDLAQDALSRLVGAFRVGAYDAKKGRFRSYLSSILKRLLIDRSRRMAVRFESDQTDSVEPSEELASNAPDAAVLADLNWRIARHQAAVAHVFARSALGEQSRRIYVMSTTEGLSAAQIGERLGIKPNAVRSILSRVSRMIAAVEGEYE